MSLKFGEINLLISCMHSTFIFKLQLASSIKTMSVSVNPKVSKMEKEATEEEMPKLIRKSNYYMISVSHC